MRQTLERADQFLGLSSLVAVVLAAVAIALAASRYLRRHLDAAAMLRCFGASRARTLALFVLQFALVALVASAVGILLALGGQQLLVVLLGSIASGDLPAPGAIPAIAAFATGILLLLGFALPPLIALAGAPPLRVLRRDLPRPRPGGIVAYALGASVIAALIGWQAQDAKTGAIVVAGIGGLLAAAALTAWLLVVLLKRLPQRGVTWRFGLANLRRRPLASSLQIGALALGLMALLLLTVVRGDLMRNWRASLPPDAPESFPRQRAARPGRRRARGAQGRHRHRHSALSDGARPARRGQRRAARHDEVRRYAGAPPGRARIQPVLGDRALEDEPHHRRQMVRRRDRTGRRHLDGRRHRRAAAA